MDARLTALQNLVEQLTATVGLLSAQLSALAPSGAVIPVPSFGRKKGGSAAPVVFVGKPSQAHEPGPWQTKQKKRKEPESKPTVPALRLIPSDWTCPVLEKKDLRAGVEGVCMISSDDAYHLYGMLEGTAAKIGLVTEEQLEFPDGVEHKSIEFQCKCIPVGERVTVVKRYICSMGTGELAVKYLKDSKREASTIKLEDTSCKLVLQVMREFTLEHAWQQAVKNPGAYFRDYLKGSEMESEMIHTFRPTRKTAEQPKSEWLEQVVLMKARCKDKFLRSSGRKGVFVREFVTADCPASLPVRIIWMQSDTTILGALDCCQILGPTVALGLACNRNGLGIRVHPAHYIEAARKIHGEDAIPLESSVFEVGKVPIWALSDDVLKAINEKTDWEATFLRPLPAKKGTKTFLVRAKGPPKVRQVILNGELITLQPAKPMSRSEVKTRFFAGKKIGGGQGGPRVEIKTSIADRAERLRNLLGSTVVSPKGKGKNVEPASKKQRNADE